METQNNNLIKEVARYGTTVAAATLANIGAFNFVSETLGVEFTHTHLFSGALCFRTLNGTVSYTIHRALWGTSAHTLSGTAQRNWQAMSAVAVLVCSVALFLIIAETAGVHTMDSSTRLAATFLATSLIFAPGSILAGYVLSHYNVHHLKQD